MRASLLGEVFKAGNWAFVNAKILRLKKSSYTFKGLYAIVNCLQFKGHLKCMSYIYSIVIKSTHALYSEPSRRLYMRQSIALTGLSTPEFNDALASICTIDIPTTDNRWKRRSMGTINLSATSFH